MQYREVNAKLNSLHEESVVSSNSSSCNAESPEPGSQILSLLYNVQEQPAQSNSKIQDKSIKKFIITSQSEDCDEIDEILNTVTYSPQQKRKRQEEFCFNTRLTKSLGDITDFPDPKTHSPSSIYKSNDDVDNHGIKLNKSTLEKPTVNTLASESAEFSGFQRPFEGF